MFYTDRLIVRNHVAISRSACRAASLIAEIADIFWEITPRLTHRRSPAFIGISEGATTVR
jgi:hypothetical protein